MALKRKRNWLRDHQKRFRPEYDGTVPHKFLVTYSSGEYEDSYTGYVCVVDTEEEAERIVDELWAADERVEDLAIKDFYPVEPWELDEDDDPADNVEDRAFSRLENEWHEKVIRDMFPEKAAAAAKSGLDYWGDECLEDLGLTDEEQDLYYAFVNSDEYTESFKRFMVEDKGISPEVADATIRYDSGSWKYERRSYSWEPVVYRGRKS